MMLKPVGRCIAGVTVLLGVMVIAGCAPRVEEVVVEEPAPEVLQPFAGVESFSDLDDAGQQAYFDLLTLIRLSSTVQVRIMGPTEGEDPTACNRRLDSALWPGYILLPGQMTWRIQQEEPGLWMKGDSLHIERKRTDPDPCFLGEPFSILYPDLQEGSGPPDLCVPMDPIPATWRHYWDYSVELRNTGCDSEGNLVDSVDPVVIIEPGRGH